MKEYEDSGLSPLALKQAVEIENGLNEDGSSIARVLELLKADKEGRVVVLPFSDSDDVEIKRGGIIYKSDHWNIHLTAFAENQPTPSGKKVALFDLSEVQESMEGKG